MTQKNATVGTAALISRHVRLLLLLSLVLSLVLAGCQTEVNRNELQLQNSIYDGNTVSVINEEDPVMSLLGKTFQEIEQILGEPDEKGAGNWLGPHRYMTYEFGKSSIQFFSPDSIENEIAVSILLGSGLSVLGAKVGMTFEEIADILGEPDSGPELGMDNLYYSDYYSGEINNGMPDVFISFIAYSMDSPTEYVFVKWEAFNYEEIEILQIDE